MDICFVQYLTMERSPMSFFASTDTGVTLNRFSQDLMLIDMELPVSALNTFASKLFCITSLLRHPSDTDQHSSYASLRWFSSPLQRRLLRSLSQW